MLQGAPSSSGAIYIRADAMLATWRASREAALYALLRKEVRYGAGEKAIRTLRLRWRCGYAERKRRGSRTLRATRHAARCCYERTRGATYRYACRYIRYGATSAALRREDIRLRVVTRRLVLMVYKAMVKRAGAMRAARQHAATRRRAMLCHTRWRCWQRQREGRQSTLLRAIKNNPYI